MKGMVTAMSYNGFSASTEIDKFLQEYGEEAADKLDLLYIAYEIYDLLEQGADTDDFDELCADVLEIAKNERFQDDNLLDVADAVLCVMEDNDTSVEQMIADFQENPDQVMDTVDLIFETEAPADGDGEYDPETD